MNEQRYTLVLEATPRHHAPAIVRLRRLLKVALRTFGLRCVECRPLDPPGGRGGQNVSFRYTNGNRTSRTKFGDTKIKLYDI